MGKPEYHKQKYYFWKANGLCVYCGIPAIEGMSFCSVHRNTKTESARKCRIKLRHEVFNHYGKSCVCCGESTFEFLTIDHIDGGGRQHRIKEGVTGGFSFYSWLKQHEFPEGFQTLCWNCNTAKHYWGKCPHAR